MSTLTRINGGFAMAAVWLLFMAPSVSAKVSTEEAARLGQDLTAFGAEQAATPDGRIPAYDGGLPRQGQVAGEYRFTRKSRPRNRYSRSVRPIWPSTRIS